MCKSAMMRVDHTYRDYSGFAPSNSDKKFFLKKKQDKQSHSRTADDKKKKKTDKDKDTGAEESFFLHGNNFPHILYDILSCPEMSHIITFMPHGRAWKVLKPEELESQVLGKFFRQSKYASFARQINGWGFRRITQGADKNCYYHELFLRGMPHLLKYIKRPALCKKLPTDPKNEPNFYQISKMYPIPNYYGESSTVTEEEKASEQQQQQPPRRQAQHLAKKVDLKPDALPSMPLSKQQQDNLDGREALSTTRPNHVGSFSENEELQSKSRSTLQEESVFLLELQKAKATSNINLPYLNSPCIQIPKTSLQLLLPLVLQQQQPQIYPCPNTTLGLEQRLRGYAQQYQELKCLEYMQARQRLQLLQTLSSALQMPEL